MKVVLTHGYFIEEDEKEQAIMRPYPPLGLLYISAFLHQKNVPNEIFDSTFSSKAKLRLFLLEQKPEVLAIYTNLMTKLNVIDIMAFAKELLPKVKIILGGPDVTYNIQDYLENGAEFIVLGEGEQTMLELVQAFETAEDTFNSINGIAFIDGNGDLVKTAGRQKLKDLDELPIPNRDGIDISKYLNAWKEFHGESALSISTQRGCPYTCKWCSTAVYGQSYRRRSPENVVKEIKEVNEKYNPDTIWIVDDVFTVSHKWLDAFLVELEKQQVTVKFECITRADRMNNHVIEALKRAGCFRVWIGAESGSQKIIDAMDRRVSVHEVREMIQETRKAGIEAGTFIMLGYPGETKEDINETINHLKISNPDHFTITIAYPIKGTALYNEIEDRQIEKLDWSKTTDRDRDFVRTYPRKYYEHAVKLVVNEVNYYKRKSLGKLDQRLLLYKVKSVYSRVLMFAHSLN